MADEDVIKRRLLIDGDGTGDDRRLNLLHKSFIKWASSDVSSAESKVMQDRLLSQLAQVESSFKESRMVAKANAAELKKHESLLKGIKLDIEKTKEKIETLKAEFEEAKIVRNNQVEYEAIINAIKEQPSRKVTGEELRKVKEELHTLEEKRSKLNSVLDLRRKQCRTLISSIQQLRSLVATDENKPQDNILDDFDDEDLDILSRTAESDEMDVR